MSGLYVCVYMYICVCVYIYIYVSVCLYIHIYTAYKIILHVLKHICVQAWLIHHGNSVARHASV